MRYRFIKEWHEFQVGDRVPSSVNHAYLKRHGYIAHYSFTQEYLENSSSERGEIETAPISLEETPKKGKRK